MSIIMRKYLNLFLLLFYSVILFPHILFYFFHKNKDIIYADIEAHNRLSPIGKRGVRGFIILLSQNRYFRNIFYFRIGSLWGGLLNLYIPKERSFIIDRNSIIGKGFVAFHPYSTILNVKFIGENCVVRHLSTFGNKDDDNLKIPTIQNNVVFGANVIVVGNINIGDNATIGAGSVVTKNVPDNTTIAGNPAQIIKRDGNRVREKLV